MLNSIHYIMGLVSAGSGDLDSSSNYHFPLTNASASNAPGSRFNHMFKFTFKYMFNVFEIYVYHMFSVYEMYV